MKYLKVLVVLSMVFMTSVFGKNITAKDLGTAQMSIKDINQINKIYADCLCNYDKHCCNDIIMIILKQKMLYPTADFDCLMNPLKKIVAKSNNYSLRQNAITALIILSKDYELNLTREQLYNFDTNKFFAFVNYQLPDNYVLTPEYREFVKY